MDDLQQTLRAFGERRMQFFSLASLVASVWILWHRPGGFTLFYAYSHMLVSFTEWLLPEAAAWAHTNERKLAMGFVILGLLISNFVLLILLPVAFIIGVDASVKIPMLGLVVLKVIRPCV